MPLTLDHIGITTPSIESLANILTALTDYSCLEEIVKDPYHGARIQFLSSARQPYPRIELIEPLPDAPLLHAGLEQGGGVHHLCFQVASVDEIDGWCRKTSIRKVFGPSPAPAFGDNRQVVFVHSPGLGLVEFVATQGAESINEFGHISASPLIKSLLCHRKALVEKDKT